MANDTLVSSTNNPYRQPDKSVPEKPSYGLIIPNTHYCNLPYNGFWRFLLFWRRRYPDKSLFRCKDCGDVYRLSYSDWYLSGKWYLSKITHWIEAGGKA